MRRVDQIAGCAGAALIALAWGVAATAPAPNDGLPISPALSVEAFRTLTSVEQAAREKAMDGFPNDPWSQSDDFQSSERDRVNDFANKHQLRRQEIFRALDEGLRASRPLLDGGVAPPSSVPRCRPRPL